MKSFLGVEFTDRTQELLEWLKMEMRRVRCDTISVSIAPINEAYDIAFGLDRGVHADAICDNIWETDFVYLTSQSVLSDVMEKYIIDAHPREKTRLLKKSDVS